MYISDCSLSLFLPIHTPKHIEKINIKSRTKNKRSRGNKKINAILTQATFKSLSKRDKKYKKADCNRHYIFLSEPLPDFFSRQPSAISPYAHHPVEPFTQFKPPNDKKTYSGGEVRYVFYISSRTESPPYLQSPDEISHKSKENEKGAVCEKQPFYYNSRKKWTY